MPTVHDFRSDVQQELTMIGEVVAGWWPTAPRTGYVPLVDAMAVSCLIPWGPVDTRSLSLAPRTGCVPLVDAIGDKGWRYQLSFVLVSGEVRPGFVALWLGLLVASGTFTVGSAVGPIFLTPSLFGRLGWGTGQARWSGLVCLRHSLSLAGSPLLAPDAR